MRGPGLVATALVASIVIGGSACRRRDTSAPAPAASAGEASVDAHAPALGAIDAAAADVAAPEPAPAASVADGGDDLATSQLTAAPLPSGAAGARASCDALARAQSALWERARRSFLGDAAAPCAPTPIKGTGACVVDPSGDGAWALTVGALSVEWTEQHAKACDLSARIDVVRFGGGRVKSFTPGPRPFNYRESRWTTENTSVASLKVLGDWNGDGAPEVRVTIDVRQHEAERSGYDGVLSADALAIGPYAPAMRFWPRSLHDVPEIRDVDADGRLDLVYFPYRARGESVFGFALDTSEAKLAFLAHALPDGSFATDDAAARAFAQRACPIAPSGLVLGDGTKDPFAVGRRVACARVWGVTPADLARPLKESCPKMAAGVLGRDDGTCPPWLDAWRREGPPLVLEPSGVAPLVDAGAGR